VCFAKGKARFREKKKESYRVTAILRHAKGKIKTRVPRESGRTSIFHDIAPEKKNTSQPRKKKRVTRAASRGKKREGGEEAR